MINRLRITDTRKELYYDASQKCRALITMLEKVEGLCERGMRDTIDPMQEHTDRTMHGMINSVLSMSERFLFVAVRACTGAFEGNDNGQTEETTTQPPATSGECGEKGSQGRTRRKRDGC